MPEEIARPADGSPPELPLRDRVVIVTGAGQGLGEAYALAVARAGAATVLVDVNAAAVESVAERIRSAGGIALAQPGSVTSWEDSERVVATALERFGRLDGYVANAAVMHMGTPWEEQESALRRIVEINVLGVLIGVRHAMGAMVASGAGGSIVTVVSGAQHGIAGMSAYGATKGAVNAMTANWAIEGAPHGIRVNAVSPWAMTPMTADHLDQSGADPSSFPTPDEIAPLVVALLSDATSPVNGRIIRFDGRSVSAYRTDLDPISTRDGSWEPEELGGVLSGHWSEPAAS